MPAKPNPKRQANPLAHPAARQRGHQRADIDPHIEDRKTGIAAVIGRPVELSDDRAHVGLQQAGTEDQEAQAAIESR